MKTVFSHNFDTFLINFSNMGTSVFAFSVLYNFYFFTVQKIRIYKKRKKLQPLRVNNKF